MGRGKVVLLAMALFGGNARAQDTPLFLEEWGPNLLAAENGCRVEKAVNQFSEGKNPEAQYGPKNLIDGSIVKGQPFSAWDIRKGPAQLELRLAKPARIKRFVLLNDSSSGGSRAAKNIDIAVSSDNQQWVDVQACTLTQAPKMQTFELEDVVEATSVRITIKSGYAKGFAILEEFAAFGDGKRASSMFRGTEEHDVMELVNGDVLGGRMLNESIQMQTSYARLSFRYEDIASLVLKGGEPDIERITVLNGDVFSGFLLDKGIKFQLPSGQDIEVRRERINRLGMRIRATEEDEYPRHDVIVLKNGSRFTGAVKTLQVTLRTPYATLPTKITDIALIEFRGEDRATTRVTLKNRNTMQGMIIEEDIAIDLDFGPEILIYKDKIDRITFRE